MLIRHMAVVGVSCILGLVPLGGGPLPFEGCDFALCGSSADVCVEESFLCGCFLPSRRCGLDVNYRYRYENIETKGHTNEDG